MVDEAKQPLEIGDIAPFDMGSNEGKLVWYIAPTLATGYAPLMAQGAEEAGAEAGLQVKVFDAQGQPNVMVEGVSQAIANNADAIVIHAIAPEAVSGPLAEAEAAGIPVLSVLNALDPDALPAGITATFDPDIDALGRQMAAYALMDAGCEANSVVFYSSVFPILSQMNDAIQENSKDMCADCPITEENLDIRTMSQELPGQTQNLLRSNTEVTHVLATFDSAALFMIQGITELDSDVKVVGANGNDANIDLMRSDGPQIADAAYPPGRYAGWGVIDQVGRLLSGENAEQQEFPVTMLDASNVGSDDSLEQLFPGLVGFEDSYREAWGLA